VRPVRGAPKWDWDAYIDSIEQTDETGLPAARRAMAAKPVYDALSEEIDRSPIVRFMSGAGAGLEAGEPAVPSWPVVQEAD
jgi:hypothetical protein